MSEKDAVTSAVREVSQEFARLLVDVTEGAERRQKEADERSELRHAKTDQKLDEVIIVMTENLLATNSSNKDLEYAKGRIDKLEERSEAQEKDSRELANKLLITEEREKVSSAGKGKLLAWIGTISSSVVVVAIVAWFKVS